MFGIGKYNIEDIENDSSAVVQKLMTVFQAFCEKVMSKMVGVWGCSSPEVLAAGDDKKEGNKRLKRSTGEEVLINFCYNNFPLFVMTNRFFERFQVHMYVYQRKLIRSGDGVNLYLIFFDSASHGLAITAFFMKLSFNTNR